MTSIEETQRRYADERAKRLRSDGVAQYVAIDGPFARFGEDPFTPSVAREPIDVEVTALIIGAGFGGLLTAVHLDRAVDGLLLLVEIGGDVGGTWYWNRYPGAQCDVESYVYLPLLEETGYIPSERYAHADEIRAHCRRIADQYDLRRRCLFSTQVRSMAWSEDASTWHVQTDRGDRIRAQFVITHTGPMSKPKLPGIPGLDRYAGHAFHTSRWDFDYTGGDSRGGLTKLVDKRVAIIGTGATAVQCVPHVAEWAEHLYVVQRTPSSIDVRANAATDPDWVAALDLGWQRARIESFTTVTQGDLSAPDLVGDQWTDVGRRMLAEIQRTPGLTREAVRELFDRVDFEKMEELRARVDAIVADPAIAERLKPWYRLFCKRPCFHDSYLDTFNRANVELVDTDGRGVERLTPDGFVAAGQTYDVDCIIFATGFEVGTSFTQRVGFDVHGRVRTLAEHWADGVRTLHGLAVSGFPNLIVFGQGQGAFAVNYVHLLLEAAQHIAYVIGETRRRGTCFEVTPDAEEAWVRTILETRKSGAGGPGGAPDCTPGYYNNEGQRSPTAAMQAPYGAGPMAFFSLLSAWRAQGTMSGLVVR